MLRIVNQLLNVPSTDPDDARRRKLLNILLIGLAVPVLVVLLLITILPLFATDEEVIARIPALYQSGLATLIGIVIIYTIGRYWSGPVAGSLLLLLLILILAFSDEPLQVIGGRTLFYFVIPITIASVLLSPVASFVMAGVVSLLLAGIALRAQLVPNIVATVGFFIIALVSWLSARSLENALRELRVINRELDQRVAERTHDLAEALSRERVEASKSQAILEGIADGVIVFDNDGKAVVANPAIGRLLELPSGEIPGRAIEELMNGDVERAQQKAIADMLRSSDQRHSRSKFVWGDKTLSATFAPVRAAPGQVTGTVGVFRDFTQEATVDRMKSAFVSMVSHELRTPLNAIQGYAEMLKEAIYGPLLDRQRGATDRILTNTRRLLTIVNDLLNQAQIEAGRVSLEIAEFAPAQLIDDVQGVMGELARAKGLELTGHVAEGVPASLSGDPQRLNQILVNLVNNAVKFTDRGMVSVLIGRPDAEHWSLGVLDTGPGIPAEEQPYIFEPFRQVEGLTTRQYGGVGLGLSIVKRLVALMGGDITLTSEVGRGSTFTVVLPLVPREERAS